MGRNGRSFGKRAFQTFPTVGIVDPSTASFTVLGNPGADDPVSGLCADTSGRLFGSHRVSNNVTNLIEIDRSTGARIGTIGPIQAGGQDMRITDLACQPGTGVLFGLDNSSPSRLFTIDKATAEATLVGTTGVERGGLAFAPDGRLFAASTSNEFAEISPTSAQVIGMVHNTTWCIDGLAVRRSDKAFFAVACDDDELLRIDPATGSVTEIVSGGGWGQAAFQPASR